MNLAAVVQHVKQLFAQNVSAFQPETNKAQRDFANYFESVIGQQELLELFGQANMLKWHLKQVPINSHPQSLHLERESYVFDEILEPLNSIVANREPHLEGFELAAQRDAPVLDKNTSSLALRI